VVRGELSGGWGKDGRKSRVSEQRWAYRLGVMVRVLPVLKSELGQFQGIVDFAAEDLCRRLVGVEHKSGGVRLALIDREVRPL
jgi:hypothetical protein